MSGRKTVIVLGLLLLLCGAPTAHAQKTLYLTLDMDMSGKMYKKTLRSNEKWYDPALLSYIEENKIAVTFFVSGLFVKAYPDLIKGLSSSTQFSFQNHSYDESSFVPHCYKLKTLTTDAQKSSQIEETESIIKKYTGQTATYFRFPGICTDAHNDALVRSLGYTISDGTVISGDPFNKNSASIVNAVLSNAKDGSVIIMHVGGRNAPKSLEALEQIVPRLNAEGYQFAKL